jgi:hypothetical protein
MIGPFVEIRRDYTISFGSRVSLAGLAVCLVALFLTVDREQQEVIETMVTVVSVFAKVKIKLYIFWQSECDVLLRKGNWPILDHLMLAEQANFRHGPGDSVGRMAECVCPYVDAAWRFPVPNESPVSSLAHLMVGTQRGHVPDLATEGAA